MSEQLMLMLDDILQHMSQLPAQITQHEIEPQSVNCDPWPICGLNMGPFSTNYNT